MEHIGQEVVASNVVENDELREGFDLPLKLAVCDALESSIGCSSMGSDWHESSSHDYAATNRTKYNDLSRFRTPLVGSEPLLLKPCSINNMENVVGELTLENCRTQACPSTTHLVHDNQPSQQNLYRMPIGNRMKNSRGDFTSNDKDAILWRAGERLTKMSSDLWPSKHPHAEQVSLALPASGKTHMVSNTPEIRRMNYNLSRMLVKKDSKEKDVVHKEQEAVSKFGSTLLGENDAKMQYFRRLAVDSLIKSSARNDQLLLHGMEKSDCEALHHGINLRDLMKPGCRKRDKMKSLWLFKQIVELVEVSHSQGVALLDLRPSFFTLLPHNKVVYSGSSSKIEQELGVSHDLHKKRPFEQVMDETCGLVSKKHKVSEDTRTLSYSNQLEGGIDVHASNTDDFMHVEFHSQKHLNEQSSYVRSFELEVKWYASPEQPNEGHCTMSSNIYSLGILLFELLSRFESSEAYSATMLDLRYRILPPIFLSENPKEAGFCLWLLHPNPWSRPNAREILDSELMCISTESQFGNKVPRPIGSGDIEWHEEELEMLLHFLNMAKEHKQNRASKLVQDIERVEEDIMEVQKRHLSRISTDCSLKQENPEKAEVCFKHSRMLVATSGISESNMHEAKSMRNSKQIEDAYFTMRSQVQLASSASRAYKDSLKNRDRWSAVRKEEGSNMIQQSVDPLGAFFDGLCRYARYSKLQVCGSLRSGDAFSSTNAICSLSFDRDDDYIAVAAGASRKIKLFEYNTLLDDSMDVHYPVVEMSNKSKLSSVSWNNYIKNYLASTDYDGVVKIWDAGTGQGFSEYAEHKKRAWSVDFSVADPMVFASGSCDCSVKLWSINERSSIGTIPSPANVCCVQFAVSSTHFLAFGSADYKVYCYDLRHTRIPWCILAGHKKAVSYVKFLDSETIVSASTDNTLKLWDLNKTSATDISSSACGLTFTGHTNEKNFVGLSVLDGYIACGSETNEVYCYYKSLPMPITSHKFSHIDPISGNEIESDSGQFVSSVCWRRKSNMLLAANSNGNVRLLQMK